MNIQSNPWTFEETDVVSATISAIALNADGTVSITTSAAHGITLGTVRTLYTVADCATAAYNRLYYLLAVPDTTHLTLVPIAALPSGTSSASSGTVALNQYAGMVRIEDISWQKVPASASLDIRDKNGNIIWQASQPSTANVPPNYNRGKLFWVNGITLLSVGTSPAIIIATVN